jgi:hypothetical protein
MRLTLPFARPTRTTSMPWVSFHESMFGRRSEPTAIWTDTAAATCRRRPVGEVGTPERAAHDAGRARGRDDEFLGPACYEHRGTEDRPGSSQRLAAAGDGRGGALRAASEAAPLMVETNDLNDVGAAFDRAWVTDLAIPNGFGRPTTTACSASTWPAAPASRSKSATAPGRSARTGTTAATTASAPGATSRCARSQPQDPRREARQHQRPSRPRPRSEIADIAKLSGRFGPELMTMTWPGPLPASARVTTSPRAGSSSGVGGRRRP